MSAFRCAGAFRDIRETNEISISYPETLWKVSVARQACKWETHLGMRTGLSEGTYRFLDSLTSHDQPVCLQVSAGRLLLQEESKLR
jgi:hypothetical protein